MAFLTTLTTLKTTYLPVRAHDRDHEHHHRRHSQGQDQDPDSDSDSPSASTEYFLSSGEKHDPSSTAAQSRKREVVFRFLPWILHFLFMLVYTTAFIYRPNVQTKTVVLDPFDAPTDAPIEYEMITFFEKEGHDSPYFGPSDPGTDAAWGALLTNGPGIVWIDDEAAAKLHQPTERVRGYDRKIDPKIPGYMGNIEIMHQLHCLNRIRMLFYNRTREDVHDEIPEMREPHTMHCFEYLRQVLQCHGDVGIMSLGWDAAGEAYTAVFDMQRQCRRFDLIQEWTLKHQVLSFEPVNQLNASDFLEDGEEEGVGGKDGKR